VRITHLTDDLDGSSATQTVHFSLDGVAYQLDLNDQNAAALRDLLSRYVQAGSYIKGHRIQRASPQNGAQRRYNRQIREWAAVNGMPINRRGRIPVEITKLYGSHRETPSSSVREGHLEGL